MKGFALIADAVMFALLVSLAVSSMHFRRNFEEFELAALSASLEDISSAASLKPDEVLQSCDIGAATPGLEAYLSPALGGFRYTRFGMSCGGAEILLGGPAGWAKTLATNRVISGSGGEDVRVVTFYAAR